MQRQRRQTFLHHRLPAQQPQQRGAHALDVGQGIEQIQHAPAFSEQRLVGSVVGADRFEQGMIGPQRDVVQFRISARQIQAVAGGQHGVMNRREKHQLCAHGPQQIEAGAISEGKGFVTGHGNAHAVQQRLGQHGGRRLETDHRRQVDFAGTGQGISGCIKTCVQVIQLTGLNQAKMAAGQLDGQVPGQRAVPAQTLGEAVLQ